MGFESVQSVAEELFAFLSSRFPVCCASDEFVFFPQAVDEAADRRCWDDFSTESVQDTVAFLRSFRDRITLIGSDERRERADEDRIRSLLTWTALALEEQFTIVRTHCTQPTFYLTLATAGLVEAIQRSDTAALTARLETMPDALDSWSGNLSAVPELYRDVAVGMAREFGSWLALFGKDTPALRARHAVERYKAALSELSTESSYTLPRDVLERIVTLHTGSGLAVREAVSELEDEVVSVRRQLEQEAAGMGHGRDWQAAFHAVEREVLPAGGKKELLMREFARLKDHCGRLGFIPHAAGGGDNIAVASVPEALTSVRASDSYSALPGHPFRGGIFYVFPDGVLGSAARSVHPVYRMTAAHEAYPGHHLLDHCRWENREAVLRPLEHPLFYEGWACFGEDLMQDTGAFDRPCDRLILLRRRFRHAVRGLVDMRIHSGTRGLEEASQDLTEAGFDAARARETVEKYALRPAYQMCYTVGRRIFQRLFESYGQHDVSAFVKTVLTGGELRFADLEKVLKQTLRHHDAETRRHGE